MRAFAFILFFFAPFLARTQETVLSKIPVKGADTRVFIPKGYDTLATAAGDLDKDGAEDMALVLKPLLEDSYDPATDTSEIPPRLLLVLLKKADGYSLAAKSDGAVLCRQCGGVFGDPFASIMITKGLLQLDHYGGSAWRWGYTHKFRLQKQEFVLIGETSYSYFNADMCEKLGEFAATKYKDVNLLTGAYEEKKVSEKGCKMLVNKKGKQAVKPLKKLNEFNIEN